MKNSQDQNPIISVIVPCYNYAHFLGETLQSVLDQTYPHWECIIVNDGSTDNTEEVAQKWVEKDVRFRYIRKENGGLSSARNAGLEKVKGQYIQLLDADDIIDSTKFEKQADVFNENVDLSVVYSDFMFFTDAVSEGFKQNFFVEIPGDPLESFLFKWSKKGFIIPIHCALFKAEILRKTPFNEQLKGREDWLLWVQLAMNGAKFQYIDRDLAFYRKHGGSMVHNEKFIIDSVFRSLFYAYELIPDSNKDRFLNEYSEYFLNVVDKKNERINKISNSLGYKVTMKLNKILKKIKLK